MSEWEMKDLIIWDGILLVQQDDMTEDHVTIGQWVIHRYNVHSYHFPGNCKLNMSIIFTTPNPLTKWKKYLLLKGPTAFFSFSNFLFYVLFFMCYRSLFLLIANVEMISIRTDSYIGSFISKWKYFQKKINFFLMRFYWNKILLLQMR